MKKITFVIIKNEKNYLCDYKKFLKIIFNTLPLLLQKFKKSFGNALLSSSVNNITNNLLKRCFEYLL